MVVGESNERLPASWPASRVRRCISLDDGGRQKNEMLGTRHTREVPCVPNMQCKQGCGSEWSWTVRCSENARHQPCALKLSLWAGTRVAEGGRDNTAVDYHYAAAFEQKRRPHVVDWSTFR